MNDPNNERVNYHLVTVGGVAVGWVNPTTGAYAPAVRVDLPGQPVGTCKPLLRDGWDR